MICPRHVTSLIACSCQIVLTSRSHCLALTPRQYKEYKTTGKVITREDHRHIAIIGTRRRDAEADYQKTLRAFLKVYRLGDSIVSGGCEKGGDHFAEKIALEKNIPIKIHRPDKSKLDKKLFKTNPRAAWTVINHARNELIAADADVVIACVAPDRKGGTEDTLKKFAKKLGKTESQLVKDGLLRLA